MPYHIDYRPKNFDEVIGNKSTIKSLKSLLSESKPLHAYLLHGASGCGKTTIARIIANELECSPNDFLEINAGNNRGIDTARDIIKNVQYPPLSGKTKVILLDEAHQLTRDFSNALLKVLEDTPEHVYFIFCTTEPQKIITTIRNRCVMFEVNPLNEKQMNLLLLTVVNEEKARVSIDASNKIVEKAEGCPRQALILLEQVIHLKPKAQLKAIKVFKTQEAEVIDLCRGLMQKQMWIKTCVTLRGLFAKGEEPERIRQAVLGYLNSVLLNEPKGSARAYIVIEAFSEPFYNKAMLTAACYACTF